ncbi:hypothetical protein KCU96_g9027, partial [Aureobasidium melanogenum]
MEEIATDLAKNVHWQAQSTYSDLDAAKDDKQPLNTSRKDPGVGKVRQDEREYVLEDDETGKGFDRNVSVCIEQILR